MTTWFHILDKKKKTKESTISENRALPEATKI